MRAHSLLRLTQLIQVLALHVFSVVLCAEHLLRSSQNDVGMTTSSEGQVHCTPCHQLVSVVHVGLDTLICVVNPSQPGGTDPLDGSYYEKASDETSLATFLPMAHSVIYVRQRR